MSVTQGRDSGAAGTHWLGISHQHHLLFMKLIFMNIPKKELNTHVQIGSNQAAEETVTENPRELVIASHPAALQRSWVTLTVPLAQLQPSQHWEQGGTAGEGHSVESESVAITRQAENLARKFALCVCVCL